MLERVDNANPFASRTEWERAWYFHGRALGRRNAPVPSKRYDRVEVEIPSFEKDWLRHGITAVGYQSGGAEPPETSYRAWQETSKRVFSQLPLALATEFIPAPEGLRTLLASATDPEAAEICYAKFMAGLFLVRQCYPRALVVITDSKVQPHDWDRYPRKNEEVLWGVTHSLAGVVLARADFVSPKEGAIPTHEVFHLLGFRGHHGNYAVHGYAEEECVMERYPKTTHLCQRDRDALRAFWGGVEETTGRRFLL